MNTPVKLLSPRSSIRDTLLVLAVCLVAAFAQPTAAGAKAECRVSGETLAGERGSSSAAGSTGNVELTTKTEQFSFGESREPMVRTLVLAAKPKLPPDADLIAEPAGDFEAEGGGDSFPVENVSVEPRVNSFGNVLLRMCLDPEGVGRGRYVGSIQVGGSNVETASVAVESTLRKPIEIAVIFALLGMVLGLIAKALADLSKDPTAEVKKAWIGQYLKRGAFFTAVLFGLVGVGLSLWQVYDVNPTWGTIGDYAKICLAGIALQVTGGTLVDLVKPYQAKALSRT